MRVPIEMRAPLRISASEAILFHYVLQPAHPQLMVMAAHWRTNVVHGEEDWFEELTADELESESFLADFAEAQLQLWLNA